MNLLSLDLGLTTGWAHLLMREVQRFGEHEFLVEDYGIISEEDLGEVLPQLRQDVQPDLVLMEKPVIMPGQLGRELQSAVTVACAVFPRHVETTPAQWKPSPYSSYPLPRGTSPHARDAVRMGIWWLKSAFHPSMIGR